MRLCGGLLAKRNGKQSPVALGRVLVVLFCSLECNLNEVLDFVLNIEMKRVSVRNRPKTFDSDMEIVIYIEEKHQKANTR